MKWHYTTAVVFKKILATGMLLPSSYPGEDATVPALWFSSNQWWEPTAQKRVGLRIDGVTLLNNKRLTMTEQHEFLGLVRIAPPDDLRLHDFDTWGRLVGKPVAWLDSLKRGGVELGANPAEWWSSFEPLPQHRWQSVEVFDGKGWQPLDR